MKVSVSSRRVSRRLAKSVGVLFILALVVLVYAVTALIAYADPPNSDNNPSHFQCPAGTHGPFKIGGNWWCSNPALHNDFRIYADVPATHS